MKTLSEEQIKERESQTIKVMGVDIPRWQDCKKCGAKMACVFSGFAYSQPCDSCKDTPEYEAETTKPKGISMTQALGNKTVAAVFEGGGRTYFVNDRGNVIKEEKSRPLKVGDKNWK